MTNQTRRFLASACFMMLFCAVPLYLAGVEIIASSLKTQLQYLAVTLSAFLALRAWKRLPLVQLLLEVTLWSMLVSTLVNLPVAFMVRLPIPFVDAHAAAVDARLGFVASDWVRFAQAHPRVDFLCNLAYISLRPVDILTLYVPILCRQPRWSSELFVALVLQLAATVLIMALAQGIGPWVVNGTPPTPRQAEITQVMQTLKHAHGFRLDMGDIPGFVAFPSWHVMLAMLSAFTIGRIRVLREVCIAWVVLVAISTLTTGWHYGVDVISGVLVGGACMWASKRLHRRWDAPALAPAVTDRRSEAVLA